MKLKYRQMIMTFLHGLSDQEHINPREFQILKNAVFKMKEEMNE